MDTYLFPLPLVRQKRHHANIPTPPNNPHNFFVNLFVKEQYKNASIFISTHSHKNYAIHDNTKVIGYVILGIYFDLKKIY